uniref:Uncharacterized protein n=1 Tax=Cajanus cajan TaxID=3821 RepID=A0A151R3C2_CAJCA|nr:hypothetical protein KK1_041822 [Cajanus cajan]
MHNILTPLYELINKLGDKVGDNHPSRENSANLNEIENHGGNGVFPQNLGRPHRNLKENLHQVIERVLNRHGFEVGQNERPYFVFAFPEYVTQAEFPRRIKTPKFSKFAGELNDSRDSLIEFPSKKKDADREVMLCPRCSHYYKRNILHRAKLNTGLTMRQIHMPQYNALMGKMEMHNTSKFGSTFVPNANVPVGKWNVPQRQMTGMVPGKFSNMSGNYGCEFRQPFNNLIKTQWRRQQRMRKATFEGFRRNRFLIPVPQKGESPRKFMEDDEDMITDCFESGFDDSLEDICGIVSILSSEYVGAMEFVNEQEDIHREDFFDDPNYESKIIWVNQVSRVIPKFNSAVFDSPTEEMKAHLKPLLLTLMIEGHEVNKVLVDGGAAINILPKTMLKRFGKIVTDLKPLNILISNYAGKSSQPEGMILLDVQIGSVKRTTMFIVTPSKANFNVLLGREWIHGVGAVSLTVHQKIFFWNDDEGLEVFDADQKEYEVGMYFAYQQLTAFAKTKPFDARNANMLEEE